MGNIKAEIPAVSDSFEKRDIYKRYMGRLSKAISEGFFLEALWILYAMIEDRTASFLYYIGFVSERNRSNVAKKVKQDIRTIIGLSDGKNYYGFNKLSGKLSAITKVLNWARTADAPSGYQKDLRVIIGKVNTEEIQSALNMLDDFRDFRNQIVHALFNKKGAEVESVLEKHVNNGYEAVRMLDNAIKSIKRGSRTSIRKRYNIQ